MKGIPRFGSLLMMAVSVLFTVGCDSTTEPVTEGTLAMSSVYTSTPAGAAKTFPKFSNAAAEITVTRARFVIRDIKYKSVLEDSLSFKASPFVLELNLTGSTQTVSSVAARFGDYRRVEFDVHRTEQPEIAALPAEQQAAFTDFLADERYSIIIEGTYTPTGGSATSFVYRSKVDAKQKIDLDPPLVIAEGSATVNATMLISSNGWFLDQQGVLVDPTDPNNEGVIDENLKSSIRVFKDNNKDGSLD